MTIYHISVETGRPNICRAKPGECPISKKLNQEAPHFSSKPEARAYAEKMLEEEEGAFNVASSSDPAIVREDRSALSEEERQFAIKTDTEMYEAYNETYLATMNVEIALKNLHIGVDHEKSYYGSKFGYFPQSEAEARKRAEELLKSENTSEYRKNSIVRSLERLDEAKKNLSIERERLEQIESRYTGWNRAILATSTNGHVHNSMSCPTCNKGQTATKFQMLPQFSGMTERQIVREAGWRACTVCYPSAPVGLTRDNAPTKMFSEQEVEEAKRREQAQSKKAAAKSDKIAKAATADGSELTVTYSFREGGHVSRERFKTEAAALQWTSRGLSGYAGHRKPYLPGVNVVINSLAEKHGVSREDAAALVLEKANARRKREKFPPLELSEIFEA